MYSLTARRRARQRRRAAHETAAAVVREALRHGDVECIEDLVPAVEEMIGRPVALYTGDLPLDQVAFTTSGANGAEIVLAEHCATRQHTLAHEIGHLVLGHRHGSVAVTTPPPGCEEVFDSLHRELAREAARNEREAEVFAARLLEIVPARGGAEVEWREAMG